MYVCARAPVGLLVRRHVEGRVFTELAGQAKPPYDWFLPVSLAWGPAATRTASDTPSDTHRF